MNDKTNQEAIRWFNRLRAPDVSSAEQHAYREWLTADPDHREAWQRVEHLWGDLDGIEPWARRELSQLNLQQGIRIRRRATRWYAGAAGLAALVLVTVAILQEPDAEPGAGLDTVYETVVAEQHRVILQDGSQLHLNTASTAEIHYTSEVREIWLSRGEALFDVVHDPLRPFVVRVRNSSVIAIGTRFAVRMDTDDIRVTVVEGKVAVTPTAPSSEIDPVDVPADGALSRVFVEPGQQVEVDTAGRLARMREVDSVKELAWQEGKLVFDGTPLREVVQELSRYIPGEVRVASDVPDHPVTGIIQIRAMEKMVDLLSTVVPVTAIRESGEVTVLYNSS